MAPEIQRGQAYNSKADVWSLGTVFYEMLTGFTPFIGQNRQDLNRNIEIGTYHWPKSVKISLEGLDFLNCCLKYDPGERLTWDGLLKHRYLTGDGNGLCLSYNPEYQLYGNPQMRLND